jgi:hypothetical protein
MVPGFSGKQYLELEGKMLDEMKEFNAYLDAVRIPLRLACATKSGWPMVVSLWYLYQDGQLFCATQKTSRVVSYLQNDPRCAFEIAADSPPYCGVRGQAMACIEEDMGVLVLEKLLVRYVGGLDNDLARSLLSNSYKEVAIVFDPVQIYRWDFSSRMTGVVPMMLDLVAKVCP